MRFDLDDEQRAIRDAVRELARARYDPSRRDPSHDTFWPELASTQMTQLCVPRRRGGEGAGLLELSLVVEELGWALAPAGFFGNAAAGLLLAAGDNSPRRGARLEGVSSGERRAAFAQTAGGETAVALDAAGAALVVVAGGGRAGVLDPAPAPGEDGGVDLTRSLARIGSEGLEPFTGSIDEAIDCVEVLLAADLVGVAQHALDLAVEHACQRQQFGRAIGAYQAVSHRCADMLVAVESARSAVLSAAWTADNEPARLPFAASVAKVAAAEAGWLATTAALQIHGGIGFTWEHPIHLFLRRAAASRRLLGSVDSHLDRVAALSGLGGAVTAGPPSELRGAALQVAG